MQLLVVDPTIVVAACYTPFGLSRYRRFRLVAPQLMPYEATSMLHELSRRKALSRRHARLMLNRLAEVPVELRAPFGVHEDAWTVADDQEWDRTYSAEYLALARTLGCPVLTLDKKLAGKVSKKGLVITPDAIP